MVVIWKTICINHILYAATCYFSLITFEAQMHQMQCVHFNIYVEIVQGYEPCKYNHAKMIKAKALYMIIN